uniref:Uncharacterized protein n=1 Tax=Zea mays TaxID=4577 RepID=C0PF77_MAIZE|nr:unknown [Zea mays]
MLRSPDLVSVVEVRSFAVKQDLFLALKKPEPCTGYILLRRSLSDSTKGRFLGF